MNAPHLKIIGEVETPAELSVADLAKLPADCQIPDVSQLDDQRKGRGVWLAGLISAVGPSQGVSYLTLHASADDFHASLPLEKIRDRSFLIYELEGQPLPANAGGPFRFAIIDSAACQTAEIDDCANVKFVDCMEFSTAKGRDSRPNSASEHAALHADDHKHAE